MGESKITILCFNNRAILNFTKDIKIILYMLYSYPNELFVPQVSTWYFSELIHFPIIANIEPTFNPVFIVPLYIYGEVSVSSEMMMF